MKFELRLPGFMLMRQRSSMYYFLLNLTFNLNDVSNLGCDLRTKRYGLECFFSRVNLRQKWPNWKKMARIVLQRFLELCDVENKIQKSNTIHSLESRKTWE